MAGLLSPPNLDADPRIMELLDYLNERSVRPLGGKPAEMGVRYPSLPSSNKAASQAYDSIMNNAESELQDMLIRKHGPELGRQLFMTLLPMSGVWAGPDASVREAQRRYLMQEK